MGRGGTADLPGGRGKGLKLAATHSEHSPHWRLLNVLIGHRLMALCAAAGRHPPPCPADRRVRRPPSHLPSGAPARG